MNRVKNIDLIIFDMDGTIFTSNVDWSEVKKKLNVSDSTILEKLYNGNIIDREGVNYLENIEKKNTLECEPVAGSWEFLKETKKRGIHSSLVTNNSKENADYLLEKYSLEFDMIITRNENMWKPSPNAFRFLMKRFNAKPQHTLSVGDSDFDVSASINSGISNVFIIQDSHLKGTYPIKIKFFKDFFDLSRMIFMS